MSSCIATPVKGRAAASVFTMAALLAAAPAARALDSDAAGALPSSLLGLIAAVAPADAQAVTTEHARPLLPDAEAAAAGRAAEVERVTVSRWARAGRASLGMGVGTIGVREPGQVALTHPSPALTVGVRLDVGPRATMYADASGAPGWETPRYNTRVGMEFKSASAGRSVGLDRGAIGVQLDSGYRLQMRPRKGGLAVYLRGQF